MSGWQGSGQDNYNSYQSNASGSNGYLITQQDAQQDFVAFDDGDDFYNNDDPDTPMSEQVEGTTTTNGTSLHDQSGNQEASRDSIGFSKSPAPQPRPPDKQPIQNVSGVTKQVLSPPDPKLAQDKLAALRARLMSQRRVGGKTPTPESTATKKNMANNSALSVSNLSVEEMDEDKNKAKTVHTQHGDKGEPADVAASSSLKQDAKSSTNPNVLSTLNVSAREQSHTSTDIEALLAEARDSSRMEDDKVLFAKANVDKIGDVPNVQTNAIQPSTDNAPSKQITEPMSFANRQHSLHGSLASSETSEQGEIREEPNPLEPDSSRTLPQPASSNALQAHSKPLTPSRPQVIMRQDVANSSQDPQIKRIDTSLACDHSIATSTNSTKLKSPTSSKSLGTTKPPDHRELHLASMPKETSDKHGDIRERFPEATYVASERKPEIDRGRPKEPYVRGSYEAYRPDYSNRQRVIEESARAAAEYKRNLQRPLGPEDRDVVMADIPTKVPKSSPKAVLTQEVADYFADADDWLEMTGYHDRAYRKKALTRHRKLVELDKQRAELEREAQIEQEERSQHIRAQSIKPRESVEGPSFRSMIARRGLPNLTMLPPPLPAKDAIDDVGIQIKDLANKEAMSARDRLENGMIQLHDSPITLSPAIKRQHSSDNDSPEGRFIAKMARTNSKEFSSDKKTQPPVGNAKAAATSLESRISVDDGAFRREYQQRSRSPDERQRSLSGPPRRASDHDIRMGRQISRGSYGSRNGYSPIRRPVYSRGASPTRTEADLYDDSFDGNPHRYDTYRHNGYDGRANSGYDYYSANQRGGQYPQYVPPNYRGRGRGRRGNYVTYRGTNYKAPE
ncbi:hypothetical protein MMC19_002079 [Ptychographa xylographoides]|nr:hypothetical protein [Ptychographa xylographoides]